MPEGFESLWLNRSVEILYRVVEESACRAWPELMRAVREAYPFYEREHWPYKQWLKAVGIIIKGNPWRKERDDTPKRERDKKAVAAMLRALNE